MTHRERHARPPFSVTDPLLIPSFTQTMEFPDTWSVLACLSLSGRPLQHPGVSGGEMPLPNLWGLDFLIWNALLSLNYFSKNLDSSISFLWSWSSVRLHEAPAFLCNRPPPLWMCPRAKALKLESWPTWHCLGGYGKREKFSELIRNQMCDEFTVFLSAPMLHHAATLKPLSWSHSMSPLPCTCPHTADHNKCYLTHGRFKLSLQNKFIAVFLLYVQKFSALIETMV